MADEQLTPEEDSEADDAAVSDVAIDEAYDRVPGEPDAPVSEELPPPAAEEAAVVEPAEALPAWDDLSLSRRQAIIEGLIFAAENPLTLKELRQLLRVPRSEILKYIDLIRQDLRRHQRALVLEEVAGGYVFRTKSELAPWLRALVRVRPPRLGRAALETLAIVAYRQPVTRAEVEDIRGVESGSILRSLLEKRLVRILGRKDDVGRPMIYGTTREFLQTFGLKDLTSLPTLRDLNALTARQQGPTPAEEESVLEQPLLFPRSLLQPETSRGAEPLEVSPATPAPTGSSVETPADPSETSTSAE